MPLTPILSSDSRYLLYQSEARNLAAGSYAQTPNLLLRDLQLSTNYVLTTNRVISASMTPDGRRVCYAGLGGVLYLLDTPMLRRTTLLTSNGLNQVSISPNGQRIAFSTTNGLYLLDLVANTTTQIGPSLFGSHPGLRFNQDGRWLVHTRLVSATNQVYLYDCLSSSDLLVSHYNLGAEPAWGHSDWPEISPDGRFVVYRSSATNLLSGVTDSLPRLVWYEHETGLNTLVSGRSGVDGLPANRSLRPLFSADGQALVFQSWADEMVEADYNRSSDVFMVLFPRLTISQAADSGPPETLLSWPYFPNCHYNVQCRNDLNNPSWDDLSGEITNMNGRAFFRDSTSGSLRKFYRIVAY